MKITLVHPPGFLNLRSLTALRPSMPLGLAYVAAALERAGHEIAVVDAIAEAPEQVTDFGQLRALGLTPKQIVERIDPSTDAIGLTNMWSFSWPLVRDLIRRIKERHPSLPIVGGGEHFTGLTDLSLRDSPVDFVVRGEGEETAVELFDWLERGGRGTPEIAGVSFREGDRVIHNEPRRRISSVDELPWPAWHLFDVETYNRHRLVNGVDPKLGRSIPLLATRGCPYRCTYCSSPGMWTTKWVARDPVDVVDEIEHYVKTYGAGNFPLQDLTAILRRDWIVQFANEILRRGLEIVWQFPTGTRCEVVDDEIAELLRRSGGRHLAFAPESGSARTRRLIQKKMTEEGLVRAVKAAVRNGLNVTTFFVLGFPHDTRDDIRETKRLARRLALLGVDDIAIGFYFPVPNTQIYRELMAKGRVDHSDRCLMAPVYCHDDRLRPENNYCEALSARELTRARWSVLVQFYGLSFLRRPWRLVRVLWNVARGVETRKLESFLNEVRRKLGLTLRQRAARPVPQG